MVQDGSGFAELEEKGTLAGENLVAGANAREDAVDGAEACALGRHIAAHLSEYDGEAGLSHECRLAAHVGSGDEEQRVALPRLVGVLAAHDHVVGYELAAEGARQARMPTVDDLNEGRCAVAAALVGLFVGHHQLGPTHLAVGIAHVARQAEQHVENGQALDGSMPHIVVLVEVAEEALDGVAQRLIARTLRAGHVGQPLLDLGRPVALEALARRRQLVGGRQAGAARLGQLELVAVLARAEVLDARRAVVLASLLLEVVVELALGLLDGRDGRVVVGVQARQRYDLAVAFGLLGVEAAVVEGEQLVEIGKALACGRDATRVALFADSEHRLEQARLERRAVSELAGQVGEQLGGGREAVEQQDEVLDLLLAVRVVLVHDGATLRMVLAHVAQLMHLVGEALEIGQRLERVAHRRQTLAADLAHVVDGVQAVVDRLHVALYN